MHFSELKIPRTAAAILTIAAVLTASNVAMVVPWILGVVGVIAGVIAYVWRGDHGFTPAFVALTVVACSLGITGRIATQTRAISEGFEARDALVVGRIVSGGALTAAGWSHVIEVQTLDGEYAGFLAHFQSKFGFIRGDHIEVFCELRPVRRADFPMLVASEVRLFNRGIALSARAREPPQILGHERSFSGMIEARRMRFERLLVSSLDGRKAGFALALLTGNKRLLNEDDRLNYADTGTAHVLAISGLHFGVVGLAIWWLVGLLTNRFPTLVARHGRRRICGLAVSVALTAYLVFVGAPVSAVRAWTIANVLIAGLVMRRQTCSATSLAAAAALIVCFDPWMVRDVGFHLSFLAAAGILTFLRHLPRALAPPTFSKESHARRLGRQFLAFVGVSTAATLATTPALAAHFGTVSWGAFWTNLIVVPLVSSVFFPLVLLGAVGVSASIPGGHEALEVGLGGFAWMSGALRVVCGWGWNLWVVGAISWTAALVLTAAIFVALISRGRVRHLGAAWLLVMAVAASEGIRETPDAEVFFIPVGQGDSTYVRVGARHYLIDGGGRRMGADPGHRMVLPFLRRQGAARLDAVVVSHWDMDHYAGLKVISERVPVDHWVVGERSEKLPVFAPLGVTEHARVGDFYVGRVPPGFSDNNRSLVVWFPGLVLLTGDIEAGAEAYFGAGLPDAPILKIPHHGSDTSSTSEFIRSVLPRVAVWSAGQRNRFGHPRPDVVKAYQAVGIKVWGTADQGLVAVQKRGSRFVVKTTR